MTSRRRPAEGQRRGGGQGDETAPAEVQGAAMVCKRLEAWENARCYQMLSGRPDMRM